MERRKTLWIPAIAAVAWTGLTIVPAAGAGEARRDERKAKAEAASRERAKPAHEEPQPADAASTSPGTDEADSHGYGSGNVVGTSQQGHVDPSRTQGRPQAEGTPRR